jgi:hypothetical protein
MDNDGAIYVSAFEHSAIARISADRSLSLVVQDESRLRWPDGFSFGPDRYVYVTNSALHYKFGGEDMR